MFNEIVKSDVNKINSFLIKKINEKELKVLKEKSISSSKTSKREIKKFFNVLRYAINPGGKRLRPLLFVNALKALKINPFQNKDFIDFFVSIEYIHTFSLIHDDLPALDNDDLRRGKPTLHKKFDEAIAVLAGDAFLSFALEILNEIIVRGAKNLDKKSWGEGKFLEISKSANEIKNITKCVDLINKSLGLEGMIMGQIFDISLDDKKNESKFKNEIDENKTAKMLTLPIKLAIILSKNLNKNLVTNEKQKDVYIKKVKELRKFSNTISSCYQDIDDILDEEGSLKVLGKKTGSDKKNNKKIFLNKEELNLKKVIVKNKLLKLKDEIKNIKENKFFEGLIDFLIKRVSI